MNLVHAGLPIRAGLAPDSLRLAISAIPARELRDPFMHQTVNRIQSQVTEVAIPKALLRQESNREPAGIIFHVSRCGSTLVAQLLAHHADVVVYSEPQSINDILKPPHTWSYANIVGALRTLGNFLSEHAGGSYVLKLSSWNTLFCTLIADAFPRSPWIFCVRDPIEVCVSLLERPPKYLLNELSRGSHHLECEARVARNYAELCKAVSKLSSPLGKVIPYGDLPNAAWEIVGPHFGLRLDPNTRHEMMAAARQYSKPRRGASHEFVSDSKEKQTSATPTLRQAVTAHAYPELDRLASKFSISDVLDWIRT